MHHVIVYPQLFETIKQYMLFLVFFTMFYEQMCKHPCVEKLVHICIHASTHTQSHLICFLHSKSLFFFKLRKKKLSQDIHFIFSENISFLKMPKHMQEKWLEHICINIATATKLSFCYKQCTHSNITKTQRLKMCKQNPVQE